MAILSIQSHVVYGYVGNKAAVYPLQTMGYDVWQINTVQFSNHTGYPSFSGEIFSSTHINELVTGLENLGVLNQCQALVSGYMGSADICLAVQQTVQKLKLHQPDLLYLCDPVIGNQHCFVKPEVLEFFKNQLIADIITPNQFEAEILSGIKINNRDDLKKIAEFFHQKGIKILVITGLLKFSDDEDEMAIFVSDQKKQYLLFTKEYNYVQVFNGTGDLFSSIFLGTYLKELDALAAAKNAVYYLDYVLRNTIANQQKELKIVGLIFDFFAKDKIRFIEL